MTPQGIELNSSAGCFCSATESTLINAVAKKWISFPGITLNVLKRHRHRLRTPVSAAGHLDQVQQNQRRRHSKNTTKDTPVDVITHIIQREYNHMDATGKYPATSHRGHRYILIMFSEDSNYIKAIPMKTRQKESYLTAHQQGLEFFKLHGYFPTFQRLDNETSHDFMKHLRASNINVDLAPPHQHRRNKAERAIRTYKNHFIATMAGVHPNFPSYAWNELMSHAEITLNLLRQGTCQQQSAWETLNGYTAHTTSTPTPWHPQAQQSLFTKNPVNAEHGMNTV